MLDTSSFSAIKENEDKYRLKIVKDNTQLILDVEEVIRFQYELHEKIASYLNSKSPKDMPEQISPADSRIARSHSLYTQNFRTIHAAYEIILNGKISASLILVRKIHESTLAQYYIGLCDEGEFSEYVTSSENDATGRTNLGYNFYKQKLYEEGSSTFASMSKVYSELSNFTHPTYKTMIDIEYNKEQIKDSLSNLLKMSLFNVLSYCQVYASDESYLPKLMNLVQPFVDEQLHNLNYELRDMFPNKSHLVNRVMWHPDHQKKI